MIRQLDSSDGLPCLQSPKIPILSTDFGCPTRKMKDLTIFQMGTFTGCFLYLHVRAAVVGWGDQCILALWDSSSSSFWGALFFFLFGVGGFR